MNQDATSRLSSDDSQLPGGQLPIDPETQSKAGNGTVDETEKRRERKRFTDRVAQRQHRKRQKLYIEELEAKLRVLRSGGQSEVAQLTAHNARLYDELKQLYGLWDEMEDLLRRQRLLRQHSALNAAWDLQSPYPDPHAPDLERIAPQHVMDELRPNAPDCRTTQQPEQTEVPLMVITPDPEEKNEVDPVLGDASLASNNPPILPHVNGSEIALPEDTSDTTMQLQQSLPITIESSELITDPHTLHDQAQRADNHGLLVDSDGVPPIDWADAYQQLDDTMSGLPSQNVHASHQTATNLHELESTRNTMLAPLSQCHNAIRELENFLDGNASSSQADHPPSQAATTSSNTQSQNPSLLSAAGGARQPSNFTSRRDMTSTSPTHSLENILDLLGTYMGQWIPPSSPVPMSMPLMAVKQSQALPLLLVPPLPRDKEVHIILDRARANISTIGPPNLSDFLFDNPKNTLSVDLKSLLAPVRQTRRTSEFLAAYWVMYLLLRWQVIQDDSAYQSVPSWLRPTPLQLTVPHPLAADLVPWPEMREELIHMSLSDETGPYDVSLDIVRHMTVDIHTLEQTGRQDLNRLEAAILDLKNWNLSEEFFDLYPQWKSIKARNKNLRPSSRSFETPVF